MKHRVQVTAAAAAFAVVTAAALAVVGAPALAVSTPPALAAVTAPGAGRPPLHVISLRSEFAAALQHAVPVRVAGVVPPVGRRVRAAARAASGCTEPNCDLIYGGGPVQHAPHVYLLLWGPRWSTSSPVYSYLTSFYRGLGVSPKDTWSRVASQYGDGGGYPVVGGSVFRGAFQDTAAPPTSVTFDDLAAEADGFVKHQHLTDLADAQIVVASQTGTCFSDIFAGNCGHPDASGTYCAWHAYSGTVAFTNLPYLLDAGNCGENWINPGSKGTYDGFSMIAGHEYAESITDPQPFDGWADPSDTISDGDAPGEIADKCAWGGSNWGGNDPEGDVTLSTGTFAMQSLWSNAAGGCVMAAAADRLTITGPASQHGTLGQAVRLRVSARSSSGAALSFRAARLPDGLSISSSGLITGKPGVTAATFTPDVTVTDSAGSAASAAFTWYVSSAAGPVTGYASRCIDDYYGRVRSGNKVDLWSCNGKRRQRITFTASGELQVVGRCVSAKSGAVLERCTGSAAQTWTRRADGEYVLKSDGQCLTDPRLVSANGTQLRLEACSDARSQRWSLPG